MEQNGKIKQLDLVSDSLELIHLPAALKNSHVKSQ